MKTVLLTGIILPVSTLIKSSYYRDFYIIYEYICQIFCEKVMNR